MPNEFKPGGLLPQHKGMKIDDVKRMELAGKYASGEEMTDEMIENGKAILTQKKHIREMERKDTPETEEGTDA